MNFRNVKGRMVRTWLPQSWEREKPKVSSELSICLLGRTEVTSHQEESKKGRQLKMLRGSFILELYVLYLADKGTVKFKDNANVSGPHQMDPEVVFLVATG